MNGRRRGTIGGNAALVALPVLFMLLVFYYPLLFMSSYIDSTNMIAEIFNRPVYITVLYRTFLFAAKVTIISLAIAYPCCCVICEMTPRAQKITIFLLTLPLWTSVLARTYAWIIILGRRGIINGGLGTMGIMDQPLELMNNTFGAVTDYADLAVVDGNNLDVALPEIGRGADENLRHLHTLTLV